jgi:hypothetical protein
MFLQTFLLLLTLTRGFKGVVASSAMIEYSPTSTKIKKVGCWSQTNEIDNDQARKPHQNVQGKEKDESSNSIGHEDYPPILIGGWNLLSVSLGTRIFILNFIGRSNHFWFSLVHEGWEGHWLEGRISIISIGQGK